MATPNGLNPQFQGSVKVASATAITAGGTTDFGLLFGATATSLGIFFGSGTPTIVAEKGSLYINTTGSSTSTRMYVCSGANSSAWVAVTTAS